MTIARPLSALVAASCRRPWATLALAALVAVLAGWFASGHMAMTSDASALISPKVAWRRAEHRMTLAFPGGDDVDLIVVDGKTPELAERGAAALAGRLAADKAHFASVTRPDGGAFLAREGLLFKSPAAVADTTAKLVDAQPFLGPLAQDPSLRGIAATLGTMLQGVARGDASLDRIRTPVSRLADALAAQAAGKPAFFSWTAMLSPPGQAAEGSRRLILVYPRLDYDDLMPGADAADAIRADARALRLDSAHGVTVRITGSVALSDEEFASLKDHWWIVAGAMVLAMLVTLRLAVRSWRITAAILGVTVAGLVVTTALGLAMIGTLTLISVAFIPLFVGLGVDFGIQVAVRFQAERHGGGAPRDALVATAAAIGPSLVLAAGAVCLGFLAFLPTPYLGVAQLGLIASVGMVVALVGSVTALPALLVVIGTPAPRAEVGDTRLAPVDRWLHANRRRVLGAFVVALVLSVAALPFVRFDFDPLHLRDPKSEAMATLADLMRDPDRNPNTVAILAPNLATAQALATRLEKLPQVDHAVTLASFVPDDQPTKLAAIGDASAILSFTLDPIVPPLPPTDAETVATLAETAAALRAQAGASPTPAAENARRLAAQFDRLAKGPPAGRAAATAMLVPPLDTMLAQARDALRAGPVTLAALPASLRAQWIGVNGQAKIEVVPKSAYGDGAGLAEFTRAVLAIAPDASGTAVSIIGAARTIAGAFVEAGVLAFVVVSLLLFAALRHLREVLFTLAPVVLSIFLTLGTCVVIGQPINFANIIAFPLLFGVGVAFHIYFVMAWRGGATDLIQSPLARAVFFSALATGTAFGSLWLSRHPGTASMGKVLMLSLAWTLVCALIFEPALLGPPQRGDRA